MLCRARRSLEAFRGSTKGWEEIICGEEGGAHDAELEGQLSRSPYRRKPFSGVSIEPQGTMEVFWIGDTKHFLGANGEFDLHTCKHSST